MTDTPKPTLLFVDDEQQILDGLRDVLRPHHREWDMEFIDSGHGAIERLALGGIDVLCTDMRMPNIGGAQVLAAARETSPETFRVVLSGQVGTDEAIEVLPITHRFLSKPCSPEEFDAVIAKMVELSERMRNGPLRGMVSGVDDLPPAPSTYAQLADLTKRGDVTPAEVAAIVERDVALTTRVLQLVNSSFFRRNSEIETVERAVMTLGFDLLRTLVLSQEVFSPAAAAESSNSVDHDVLRRHGEQLGAIVPTALRVLGVEGNGTLAGLLHDVGTLVIANGDDQVRSDPRSHAMAGGFLLELWGLDARLTSAVASHHDLRAGHEFSGHTLGTTVELCDELIHQITGAGDEHAGHEVLPQDVLGQDVLGQDVLGRESLGQEGLGQEGLGRGVLGQDVLGRGVVGQESSDGVGEQWMHAFDPDAIEQIREKATRSLAEAEEDCR